MGLQDGVAVQQGRQAQGRCEGIARGAAAMYMSCSTCCYEGGLGGCMHGL
jgi:hypothetical protein